MIGIENALIIANGGIAAACIGLTWMLSRALWEASKEHNWYERDENKIAIALWIIFITGGFARLWAVLIIKLNQHGFALDPIERTYPLLLGVSIIFVIGSMCLIRVWSRSNKEWIIILLLTAIFNAFVVIL